jgi:C4-dicarboxylate transporter DctQ subunit
LVTVILSLIAALLVVIFIAERKYRDKVTRIEENILASLLGIITIVSFVQVIARYGFASGWGGALEFTRILFAWIILLGMSYAVKINSHLGVDAIARMLPKPMFKGAMLLVALLAVLYAVIFLYSNWLQLFGAPAKGGALEYWAKIYRAGIGLDDIRYPQWARDAFGLKERVQRWVAYIVLPVGLALLAYRCVEAAIGILRGTREMMIVSHEAEDMVAKNAPVAEE